MTRYIALVDAADGAFGVMFPDAPGCTAMSTVQDEAINDAADALAEWISDLRAERRPVPAPRTVEALLKDKAVGAALAGGAFMASIPLLLESGKLARANISLDAGLLAEIDETAKRVGLTRSAFLAAAARDRIKATV